VRTTPAYFLVVVALAAVVAWGVFVYVSQQLSTGLGVTGMNTPTYWGLYISNFVFFIGLSAGGIIVAALVHAAGIERFKPVARIAELLAISCLIMATLFITLDLGRPDRFLNLFRYGRILSPLVWDVIIVSVYLIISMALGYFSSRADLVRCLQTFPRRRGLYLLLTLGYTDVSPQALERDRRILRGLAIIAVPAAVLLHSITAWILGLTKAQAGWHTALLAPLFVTSAIVSGTALVILATLLSQRFFRLNIEERVTVGLGRVLALIIPVLAYLLFTEMLTVSYAAESANFAVIKEVTLGRYALLYWGLVVGGLGIPLLLLALPQVLARARAAVGSYPLPRALAGAGAAAILAVVVLSVSRGTTLGLNVGGDATEFPIRFGLGAGLVLLLLIVAALAYPRPEATVEVGLAAALVVAGVFAERNIIVLPSLMQPLIREPHVSYMPTWVEWSLMAGVYALGVLAFVLVAKAIPLVEVEEEVTEGPGDERLGRGLR